MPFSHEAYDNGVQTAITIDTTSPFLPIEFFIQAKSRGGKSFMFKNSWEVTTHASSPIYTSFPTGLTAEQTVSHSDLDALALTRFTVPAITPPAATYPESGCFLGGTILHYLDSVSDAGLVLVQSGTDLLVTPGDKTLHQSYTFRVRKIWSTCYDINSEVFTLNVGCATATISQNPNFAATSTATPVEILAAGTGAYTFPQPTISLAWCIPTNTLTDVRFNGVLAPTAASFQAGCS